MVSPHNEQQSDNGYRCTLAEVAAFFFRVVFFFMRSRLKLVISSH